jgi:hypothetical protein
MGEYEKLLSEIGRRRMSEHVEWFRRCFINALENGALRRERFNEQQWLELRLFTERPGLYNQYAGFKISVKQRDITGFLDLLRSSGELVVFGCGHLGRNLCCFLERNGIQICCFCDNDPGVSGGYFSVCPYIRLK